MFPFADTNPTKRWEIVTFILVAINVAMFLWWNSLPPLEQQIAVYKYGFVPGRVSQLINPDKDVLVKLEFPVRLPNGQEVMRREVRALPGDRVQILASAVTCMFMHGGWMHLIGNMWFLLLFGNNVEDRLGHWLYAVFYFLGGFAATIAHWAVDPTSATPIVGASGAVAAVLGGYAVAFPHARIKTLVMLVVIITVVELPAYVFLVIWFGIQLFQGLGVLPRLFGGDAGNASGVAWWAHIGGFLTGAAMMYLLLKIVPPVVPERDEPEFDAFGRRRDDDKLW
jgi:membrane associated rhomboid family serine protease